MSVYTVQTQRSWTRVGKTWREEPLCRWAIVTNAKLITWMSSPLTDRWRATSDEPAWITAYRPQQAAELQPEAADGEA